MTQAASVKLQADKTLKALKERQEATGPGKNSFAETPSTGKNKGSKVKKSKTTKTKAPKKKKKKKTSANVISDEIVLSSPIGEAVVPTSQSSWSYPWSNIFDVSWVNVMKQPSASTVSEESIESLDDGTTGGISGGDEIASSDAAAVEATARSGRWGVGSINLHLLSELFTVNNVRFLVSKLKDQYSQPYCPLNRWRSLSQRTQTTNEWQHPSLRVPFPILEHRSSSQAQLQRYVCGLWCLFKSPFQLTKGLRLT